MVGSSNLSWGTIYLSSWRICGGLSVKNAHKVLGMIGVFAILMVAAGCDSDANIASHNLSKAADQFEIQRRVVFYNGINGEYMLTIEGLCALGNYDSNGELSVTCKTSPTAYKKHYLGLSDNVTYFVEQLDAANVSPYHYKVIFKPSSIIPDIDIR
jgi:hypothetical protein